VNAILLCSCLPIFLTPFSHFFTEKKKKKRKKYSNVLVFFCIDPNACCLKFQNLSRVKCDYCDRLLPK